jgi:hypothetical protein
MNCNNLLSPLRDNMHLIILGLYAYILLCHVKDTDYVSMIVLTAVTCIAICQLKKKNNIFNTVEGNYCNKPSDNIEGLDNNTASADAAPADASPADVAPADASKEDKNPLGSDIVRELPASMGPFDGLCLQTGNKEYWMKSPDNTALIPNDSLFSYLSSQGPLKPVFSDNSALFGPTIDGQPGSPKKMFMFANNRTSPNCCPGTFSTSTGCVCTTENQRDFIASRGNNQGGVDLQDI